MSKSTLILLQIYWILEYITITIEISGLSYIVMNEDYSCPNSKTTRISDKYR